MTLTDEEQKKVEDLCTVLKLKLNDSYLSACCDVYSENLFANIHSFYVFMEVLFQRYSKNIMYITIRKTSETSSFYDILVLPEGKTVVDSKCYKIPFNDLIKLASDLPYNEWDFYKAIKKVSNEI